MRLLLDSHALLWFLLGDADRFPSHVRDLIEDPRSHVAVSVTSLWELMLKAVALYRDAPLEDLGAAAGCGCRTHPSGS